MQPLAIVKHRQVFEDRGSGLLPRGVVLVPRLRDWPEDIEPNLSYEFGLFADATATRVAFNETRQRLLPSATSPEALWTGSFRDLNGAVVRMATLASGGRITVKTDEENQAGPLAKSPELMA